MQNENKLGTMPISKLIWNMSLPIIASMLVQALYNIVDSIFVSRICEDALTAVSMAFPLQNIIIAIAVGFGVGINALLSRALGQKNAERDAALAAAAVAAEQAAIAESTEPDTVTRTVVRAQPLAVFFTIGQTNITDKEMVNLKYAAQVIKNSPGHVYKITGYADTQTGTPQRNEYLSNQRAQNVYDALVNKFGVSPKSLKIVPRKGQSVPFDNAVLDRVSIVE